jgi:hypothetical protein
VAYPLCIHIHFLENHIHCHFSKSFKLAVNCVDLFSEFLSNLTDLAQDRDQWRVAAELVASQEGLKSMELSDNICFLSITIKKAKLLKLLNML